jgi:hypothetical protein
MKKIIFTILLSIFMFLTSALAQNIIKVAWQMSVDTNVVGYTVYYRSISNSIFSSTNVIGIYSTNACIFAIPYTLYELYVTSKDAAGDESLPSNKIRCELLYINGQGIATPLSLLNVNSTNFEQFILSSYPDNGSVIGNPPSLIYTLTNFAIKDSLIFSSPEQFESNSITNFYNLYLENSNAPPFIF